MAKQLQISKIRVDGGTQMRAKLCEETVEEYTRLFKSGAKLPPVDVFFDGTDHWLADGFQRLTGAYDAGHATIAAVVHKGTQRDAILFACGANSDHGLPRKNEDKRRSVETLLSDPEWVKWSDRRIAEVAAVTQPFVSKIRSQLITVISSEASKAADQPRVGKDGKERKAPTPKPDREPSSKPKHVVDTPKEPETPKKKYTGGTAFNVEEYTDESAAEPEQPAEPKPSGKSHFDDSRFERAYGPLVKVVSERHDWLGRKRNAAYTRTDKALGELLASFKDWQKKEPV